jgi:hypothetical protein
MPGGIPGTHPGKHEGSENGLFRQDGFDHLDQGTTRQVFIRQNSELDVF